MGQEEILNLTATVGKPVFSVFKRFTVVIGLLIGLSACRDTEQARIDSIEDCFQVKMPDCAELVRNEFEEYDFDYIFELEFHLDDECYQAFLIELPHAEKFLVSAEDSISNYQWERDDRGESADFFVFHAERKVIFEFFHL